MGLLWLGALGSVSRGPDGERIAVVGQDSPLTPDLLAVVASQAAAVQSVAAFEVADAAFLAGAVARQPSLGVSGGGFLAASDEHRLGRQGRERAVARSGLKAAIERYFARPEPQPLELGDHLGQQRVLVRVAWLARGRQDQSPRAAAGVLGHLRQLHDVPELVRAA